MFSSIFRADIHPATNKNLTGQSRGRGEGGGGGRIVGMRPKLQTLPGPTDWPVLSGRTPLSGPKHAGHRLGPHNREIILSSDASDGVVVWWGGLVFVSTPENSNHCF